MDDKNIVAGSAPAFSLDWMTRGIYQPRKGELRGMFSVLHPIFTHPGWMLRDIPSAQQKEWAEDPQLITNIETFTRRIRIVGEHGFECRLTPLPKGLQIRWLYHVPKADVFGQASEQNIMFFAGDANGDLWERLSDCQGLVPWTDLIDPKEIRSDDPRHPDTMPVKAPGEIDPADDRFFRLSPSSFLIRMPGFSLVVTTVADNGLSILRTGPKVETFAEALLSPETKLLSFLPMKHIHHVVEGFERRLNDLSPRERRKAERQTNRVLFPLFWQDATSFISKTMKSLKAKVLPTRA